MLYDRFWDYVQQYIIFFKLLDKLRIDNFGDQHNANMGDQPTEADSPIHVRRYGQSKDFRIP